jgi:hypothetical protein
METETERQICSPAAIAQREKERGPLVDLQLLESTVLESFAVPQQDLLVGMDPFLGLNFLFHVEQRAMFRVDRKVDLAPGQDLDENLASRVRN